MQALGSARTALALGGGAFLLWLGVRAWRDAASATATDSASAAAGPAPTAPAANLGAAFAGTFALTLSNPATILSFVAIFASLAGPAHAHSSAAAGWMVLGVFVGSALWWLLLSSAVSHLRHRLSPRAMRNLKRASGALLVAFGAYQLSTLR